MSCRVMSRGVGTIMMSHLMETARIEGVAIKAEFVLNNLNRLMQLSYKFTGFPEVDRKDDLVILENNLERIEPTLSLYETVFN